MLRVASSGNGDPVLLLAHGWGLDSESWGALRGLLDARHETVSFDARGFGEHEELVSGPASWSFAAAAADVAEIARSFAPRPVVAVGSSMGGTTALLSAAAHPGVLASVVSIAGAPRFLVGDDFPFGIDPPTRDGVLGQLRADYAGAIAGLASGFYCPELDRRGVDDALRLVNGAAARVRRPEVPIAILESAWASDVREELRRIRVPVLLIHGERDLASPPGVGEVMRGLVPGARVVVIPDAGHLVHVTRPREVAGAIEEFLSSSGSAR